MKSNTLAKLDRLFDEFPSMRSTGVPVIEIEAAAALLNCHFDIDYVDFLARYGGAIVGAFNIFGLRKPEWMGSPWSVIDNTVKFRTMGWPGVSDWYVISEDGFGNPIGVMPTGVVAISSHDNYRVFELKSSFEEFVEDCLHKTS